MKNMPPKEKKYRKKHLPLWFDPQVNKEHVILSWYVPIFWPEKPEADEDQVKVNAIIIGKAQLPKAMFKEDVEAFLDTEEGFKWYDEQTKTGQELLKKRSIKCPKCGGIILPRLKAKKYFGECPYCCEMVDFKRW